MLPSHFQPAQATEVASRASRTNQTLRCRIEDSWGKGEDAGGKDAELEIGSDVRPPIPGREGSRLGPSALQLRDERDHHAWVELRARTDLQLGERLLSRKRLAVHVVGDHRVVGLH